MAEEYVKVSEERMDDGTIYIGQKGAMAYVLAVMTQFSTGKSEINIKARGRAISRAVDVAEIVRRRFGSENVRVHGIQIGTEERETQDRGKINVSTIAIKLAK